MLSGPWWLPFGRVPELDARALAARLEAGEALFLLDVRSALEYRGGHISGARNLPLVRLFATLPTLELTGEIVAICLTAHRSVPAVRALRRLGLEASQLAGGMRAWRAAGLPEVR